MKIKIIGAYPPPIGGITIHVKRLFSSLIRNDIQVEVLDFSGNNSVQKPEGVYSSPGGIFARLILPAIRYDADLVVHIHVSAMGNFRRIGSVLIRLFQNYPKVLTIHSGSFIKNIEEIGDVGRVKKMLGAFDTIITVNQEQKEFLLDLGISDELISVIPAFIYDPPDPDLIPAEAKKLRGEKEVLVLTSGYLTPLYQHEILIESIKQLPKNKFGFIFAFYHQVDPDYQEKILAQLSPLENVITLMDTSPEEFGALMGECDIYVRATLRDGDSVAVREAIQMGKKVFASDVVKRPEGCDLFSTGVPESLYSLFEGDQLKSSASPGTGAAAAAGIKPIMDVYQKASAHFRSKR